MREDVMVSVIMLTYNHEKYIEEAINGVLMQECDFDYELIIANDHSTDGTGVVINRILLDHPKAAFINYLSRNANMGMAHNFMDCFKRAKGKYIALCEGDDYWTDPLKLKKQVHLLEENLGYSMVCHDAMVINEVTGSSYQYFTPAHKKQICSTKDLFGIHFCPTASVVFRKCALNADDFPDFKVLAGDMVLKFFISLKGFIYRMHVVMCVYRITSAGATEYNKSHNEELIRNRILLYDYFNDISGKKFNKYIQIETLLMKSHIDYTTSKSMLKTFMIKIYRKALFLKRKKVFSRR